MFVHSSDLELCTLPSIDNEANVFLGLLVLEYLHNGIRLATRHASWNRVENGAAMNVDFQFTDQIRYARFFQILIS